MKKLLKLGVFFAATSILLLIIGILAFYHLLRVGEFRRFLISQLEQQTQLEVQLGEGDFDIGWIAGIGFRDLKLSEPAAAQPLLTAERITARVALLPLLQRKLIFYDVRLLKPAAQLVRENDGRIPLLDKLLTLPFLQQKSREYEFDLRSIKIQQAQFQWIDRLPQGDPVSFIVRDLDAEIERVGGRQLSELIRGLLKIGEKLPPGVVLQIALKGTLERDSQNSSLSLRGKLVLPQDAFEFRNAWWSADIKVNDLPANLLIEYGRGRIPVKSMSGRLAQQIHIEGRPSERLQVSGDLEFKQLGFNGPEFFATPLSAGDGKLSFTAEWTPRRVAFSRLTLFSGDVSVSINGEIRSTNADSHLHLQLSASAMPLAAVRNLIPTKLLAPRVESLLANIQEGEVIIKKAGIHASLAQIRHWAETGIGEGISFQAELRDLGLKLNRDGALPLRDVQGHVTLENNLITLTDVNGRYGNSQLNKVAGTYALQDGVLKLQARGDLDLAEVREQLLLGVFPAQANMLADIQELNGRGRVEVSLHRIKEAPPQITGTLALDNAQLRKDDFLLSQLRG
ncbi:MAG TPA: AsmA family protein, partial [Candidatus Binatia bacterium]|nr:AsmA family protein [Candidatus Binatia bacterium]